MGGVSVFVTGRKRDARCTRLCFSNASCTAKWSPRRTPFIARGSGSARGWLGLPGGRRASQRAPLVRGWLGLPGGRRASQRAPLVRGWLGLPGGRRAPQRAPLVGRARRTGSSRRRSVAALAAKAAAAAAAVVGFKRSCWGRRHVVPHRPAPRARVAWALRDLARLSASAPKTRVSWQRRRREVKVMHGQSGIGSA
eukprot:352068-Chlamydomonas_euryale.AAC.15